MGCLMVCVQPDRTSIRLYDIQDIPEHISDQQLGEVFRLSFNPEQLKIVVSYGLLYPYYGFNKDFSSTPMKTTWDFVVSLVKYDINQNSYYENDFLS